jgi:hypothetical protein
VILNFYLLLYKINNPLEKFFRLNANILMKLDKILERQKALETQLSRMDSEMDTRMKKYLKTIEDRILKMEENNTKDSFNTDFIEVRKILLK